MALTEAKGASLRLDDDLASSASGKGASLVAIEDSAGNFASTDVEGALAELFSTVEGFLRSVVDTAVSLTVSAPADGNKLFNVTSTATITLPAAATAGEGFVLAVFNASTTSTDVVTVDASGMELINNSLSAALAKGDWCILTCTGVQWKALIYSPPAPSTGGSGGASTKIDPFLQDYGNGSDGAFSSVGASTLADRLYQHTTFNLNIGHTVTVQVPYVIIKATVSITIDGTLDGNASGIAFPIYDTPLSICNGSGSGGGGGGKAEFGGPGVAGSAGASSKEGALFYSKTGGAGGAAGADSNAGNGQPGQDGYVISAANNKLISSLLLSYLNAAFNGGDGGDGGGLITEAGAGGLGGKAGALIILIAPNITINASGVVTQLGTAGSDGANSSGNGSGGGGGGGGGAGGSLLLSSPNITNSGTVLQSGGVGGVGGSGYSTIYTGGDGGAGGAGADGYILTVDPTA